MVQDSQATGFYRDEPYYVIVVQASPYTQIHCKIQHVHLDLIRFFPVLLGLENVLLQVND